MGNDGFVWMDQTERRRGTRPSGSPPGRTAPGRRLVARVIDEGEPPSPMEPTLAEIGAQLRLWLAAKVRHARRRAPRWALERIAARLSS